MTTDADKLFRNVPFDGNSSSYPMWRGKFVGQARLRGYADVLAATCDPLPESAMKFVKTDGTEDELKRVRKGNLILLGMFEAALTDKVSYSQIKASITAEHLEGVASEVLKSLDKIHLKMRPSDKA